MRWNTLILLTIPALLFLPATATAHPPVFDPHNSCTGLPFFGGPPVPVAPIPAVNSYLRNGLTLTQGPPLPCAGPAEFGSHEGPCPPPPFIGPFGNKFCGPVIPPAPAFATCTWAPVFPTSPAIVALTVGFDVNMDGFVTVVPVPAPPGPPGETPVASPIPPGAWMIPNPFPFPGRVIAYPTDAALGGNVLPLPFPTVVGC